MAEWSRKKNNKKQKDAGVAALKVPPHSVEAEQSLLGALMLDNDAWDDVASVCGENDFYRHEHQLIFRVLADLSAKQKPFDVVTVTEGLKVIDELANAGGEIYLFEIANNTPTVANIAAYAEIVRERSVLRQLIRVANEIADSAFDTEGQAVSDLLDLAENKVFSIAEQTNVGSGPVNIQSLLTKAVDRIDHLYHTKSSLTGLTTGFKDLDAMTSGLQKSDLIIVAGRPSMGKTMLALNIAENSVLNTSLPVLIFSLEMPGDALAMRMISSLGHIDQHHLRTGKLKDSDWPRITSTLGVLENAPFFIDDTPGLSPAELRARARRVAKEHKGLGLIVVDYLQLMRVPGYRVDNRTAEISEISRSLKSLAKELSVPVIALSQLNRSLEQRSDRRPVMSDLRESGSLEQDADLILFIYRDEVYNENSADKGVAEIIIGKHRNGAIGKLRLSFQGQFVRFQDLAHQSYQHMAKRETQSS